jgi:hypothetical protein
MTKTEQALALAAKGFYVFPVCENRKAPPRMEGWQRHASRDTNKIVDMWRSHPNDNIGISTSKFGRGEALIVVDVDNKDGKDGDGELLKLELAGFDFAPTMENRTPTGGRHLVYRAVRAAKQGANVLAAGLDIRSKGGYFIGPGSEINGAFYHASDEPVAVAPQWLVDRLGQPAERVPADRPAEPAPESALDRAKHYLLNEAPLATQGEAGDETTYKVAARLKDLGLNAHQANAAMVEHWNDRCAPPWEGHELARKVNNAFRYGTEQPGAAMPEKAFEPIALADNREVSEKPMDAHPFTVLNRNYAFVVAGGGSHILHMTYDAYNRPEVKHLDKQTFHDKYLSWTMQCGKKDELVTKLWMCSPDRRSYDGIVFDPENGADVATGDRKYFNLWRGFAYAPLAADEQPTREAQDAVNTFFEHARDNVCGGSDALYRWLIGFFAHLVQRPWEKPLVALVFRGGKGVGKNALIERIGALLGGHFLLTSNRRFLTSNFNGHFENCLMFVMDEAYWAGDKQAEGQIKDLITGGFHVIEHKNKEPFKVENRTRVVIVGNEEWLVPSSNDERRFAVFDVGDGRKQDRAYFEQMRVGMERGGYRLLLRTLQGISLDGFDCNAAPATKGLLDQKINSLDAVGKWWLDCLHEGKLSGGDFEERWPAQAECDRVRIAFRRWARDTNQGVKFMSDTAFGKAWHRMSSVKSSKMRHGDALTNSYKIPTLEAARHDWEKFVGQRVEWPCESA